MVYFRQDGAPLYFASEVRNCSDEVIHWQWLSAGDKSNGRPPRSRNLSSLDFFIWGHLMSLVYCIRPRTINDLTENTSICAAFRDSTPQTSECVRCRVQHHINLCKQQETRQFKHMFP
jgi:hypothetical protein